MAMIYEKEYDLRTSDFDRRTKLTPAAILDLFQCVAGLHAEELGIGRAVMLEKQLLWVVVRVKLEILAEVPFNSTVKVKTWPLPAARATFQREYQILSKTGELLVKGSSEWVLMHSERRRLVPIREVYPDSESFCTDKNFEGKFAKLADFEPLGEGVTMKAQYTDIDMNNHVNNTKYVNFVLNAVEPQERDIRFVQIDYSKEVQPDTPFVLHALCEEDTVRAKGVGDTGDKLFACTVEFAT